jgi:WS/DGAT/MGAT family acyltransferase
VRTAKAAWEDAVGVVETFADGLTPASETPLNPAAIGPHRRFDWLRFDLAEVKSVRAALGGTLNDVVLATVVGAMRRFLLRRRIDVAGLDFRALIPVSVRAPSAHSELGNRVAQMFARLPIAEADPRRRLAGVTETTTRLKASHQVHTSELIEQVSDWTATALLTEIMRLAARQRTYNLIVTNVPGPQLPLFMLGAPLCETYPMVPLFKNQALGIALFSYAGGLFFGLNADWDELSDLHDVVGDLHDSFAELCDAARPIELAKRAQAGGA